MGKASRQSPCAEVCGGVVDASEPPGIRPACLASNGGSKPRL